jgi:hypothetical protein
MAPPGSSVVALSGGGGAQRVSSRPPILPAPARFLWELACASAAVLAVLWALGPEARSVSGPAGAATGALLAVVLAPLFVPCARPPERALWCALLVLLAVAAGLWFGRPGALAPRVLLTLATAFAWAYAIDAVLGALTRAGSGAAAATLKPGTARCVLLALVLLVTAAPVWLSPWLAQLGSDSPLARGVLLASPLVQLATAAGWDVLRSPWVYAHSVLGSLRFDYPSLSTLALIDATLCLAPSLASRASAWPRRFSSSPRVEISS